MENSAMLVDDFMPTARQRLATINAEGTVAEVAGLLSETHVGLVVVCAGDGSMAGVITKTDVVRQVAQGGECIPTVPASAIMTKNVVHCRPSDLLYEVWSSMKERGFVHIPVTDQHFRPSGVVNARDALQALLGEVKDEGSLLRDYVMGIGYR
jgi:CBS domain-containing protein